MLSYYSYLQFSWSSFYVIVFCFCFCFYIYIVIMLLLSLSCYCSIIIVVLLPPYYYYLNIVNIIIIIVMIILTSNVITSNYYHVYQYLRWFISISVYLCCHLTSHIHLYVIFNVKSYYQLGSTALHLAADKGHIEVVRMLLDRHDNIEAVINVSQNVSVASTYILHSIKLCTALYYVMILLYYVWSRSSYLYYYSGYDDSADWLLLLLLSIWLMLSSWPWLSWLW